MLGINGVAGNLQKIYTAVMEKGSVPILGRKGDYRRECCDPPFSETKIFPAPPSAQYGLGIVGGRIVEMFLHTGTSSVWEVGIIVVNVAGR
jgi:hypothetical protein